jgi:hypothetical protein|tara:strand:- start:6084 stop:7595 length:1512 start_codon:yes stop_codon:yes gene_type:complete
MHYFEFAEKDATLYEVSKSMNTGLDEILEVRKDMNSDGTVVNVSRGLIKFNLNYISESISSGLITSSSRTRFVLNLYDANSEELNVSQKLYAYPISQSWEMGSGRAQASPVIEDGCSWNYRDGSTKATIWKGSTSTLVGNTFASGTLTINNGDYQSQEFTIGGVDFVFISGSVYNNSSTEIYIASGSTTGSSLNNLRDSINNSGSLHGLAISASVDSTSGDVLILSGSEKGTSSNFSVVSSSGLFVFGNGTTALAGGTDITTTLSAHGGTWYSGSGYEAHQNFTHEPSDVRMDVTDIVWNWVDGRVPNEGFILKRSGSGDNSDTNVEEGNTTRYGNFIFFGRDTHTIYQPKLEVVWDDSKWSTGSLSPLTSDNLQDMVLHMRGLRPEYKEKSKVKFRVTGRERYPEKTYSTSGYDTGYTTVKYLPSGSTFYEIKDAYTEEVVVPFGTGSIVSCDSTGNYFNLWMDGLQSERFYRINYKIVSGSGTIDETVEFYDEKHSFKVVR